MRLYFTVLLTLFNIAAFSQGLPGYIVTLRGDTLRGIVRESSQQSSISLFIPHQQERKFTAAEVRGYGLLHNALVQSYAVKRASGQLTYAFVLPEQEGIISVYSFADEFGLLLKPTKNDTLYELTASNWHLMLHRYLGQCQAMDFTSADFLSKPYTDFRAQQYIAQYNKCVEPSWRPTANHRSVWWPGITAYTSRFSASRDSENSSNQLQQPVGSGWQVGLDWTTLRASGLQTSLGVSYTYLRLPTSEYAGQRFFTTPLLAAGINLSQRIAKPNGLGAVVGGGLRLGYSEGVVAMVYQAKVGGLLPFGRRQEVELAGTFQRFMDVNCIGLQAAYTLFKK
ncbi:hypothetical protein [Hymenobacter wooponensis]|uniref:Uncharacterized protein n=1 Tax=Hymenobacter wooponensis TaxID=1525360 RepID=A0A4Z0MIS6_9BACT|nr:hypothetical protein [Hymenobacter wooponensis]TGD79732.1 hypothetical protein EU557_16075 [Hymenobacter wooponensis]